jgi:hypothetical protein
MRPTSPIAPSRALVAWLVGAVAPAWSIAFQGPTQRAAATWLILAGGAVAVTCAVTRRSGTRALVALVAAVAIVVAVEPTSGRAMLVLGTAMFALALWPSEPDRDAGPARGISVRHLPLLVAAVLWVQHGSIALTLALLLVAAVMLLLERMRPAMMTAADAGVQRIAVAIGHGASIVIIAVAAAPLLYLPALLGAPWRWMRARRVQRSGSNWRTRDIRARDELADSRRPFAPVPVRQRRLWNGLGLLLVLVTSALIATEVRDRSDQKDVSTAQRVPLPIVPADPAPTSAPTRLGAEVPLADRPAFADAPWAEEIEREFAAYDTSATSTTAGAAPVTGTHLNVDRMGRRTYQTSCDCPGADVWLLGGSAAFGWEQRDLHTIASHLARIGEAKGLDLRMRNLGAPGWTFDQERQHLRARLRTGERPDAVIFYHGFNDVVGAVAEAAATGPLDPNRPTALAPDQLTEYSDRLPSLDPAGGPAVVGRVAGERYLERARAMQAWLEAQAIPVWFVLQVDAFATPRQLEYQEFITGQPAELVLESEIAVAFEAFEASVTPLVTNLRHLFDPVTEPIFADISHHNERGARLLAEAMWGEAGGLIRQRAR